MSQKNPTIYDIAKLTGVSPATVSRVLNEPDKVLSEKKQKVLEAIKTLNFVPKAAAVAVARKFYRKIYIVAPFFTQMSFMERLRGVENILAAEHFEVVIYSIETEDDLKDYIATLTASNRADGLILFSLKPDEESMSLLKSARFPVCFVENDVENFDCVIVQNFIGGQKAAEFFYKKGCRKPGFIGEKATKKYSIPATDDRYSGYKSYFESNGINLAENHVWIGDFNKNGLDEAIRQYLNQEDLPDCIFCSSDLIAIRFIALMKEKGLSTPNDIKVLGFDNIDIASYIGLSSISQSLDESGKIAAKMIMEHIKDEKKQCYSTLLPIHIIERETT